MPRKRPADSQDTSIHNLPSELEAKILGMLPPSTLLTYRNVDQQGYEQATLEIFLQRSPEARRTQKMMMLRQLGQPTERFRRFMVKHQALFLKRLEEIQDENGETGAEYLLIIASLNRLNGIDHKPLEDAFEIEEKMNDALAVRILRDAATKNTPHTESELSSVSRAIEYLLQFSIQKRSEVLESIRTSIPESQRNSESIRNNLETLTFVLKSYGFSGEIVRDIYDENNIIEPIIKSSNNPFGTHAMNEISDSLAVATLHVFANIYAKYDENSFNINPALKKYLPIHAANVATNMMNLFRIAISKSSHNDCLEALLNIISGEMCSGDEYQYFITQIMHIVLTKLCDRPDCIGVIYRAINALPPSPEFFGKKHYCLRAFFALVPKLSPLELPDNEQTQSILIQRFSNGFHDHETINLIDTLRERNKVILLDFGNPAIIKQITRLPSVQDRNLIIDGFLDKLSSETTPRRGGVMAQFIPAEYCLHLLPYQSQMNESQDQKFRTSIAQMLDAEPIPGHRNHHEILIKGFIEQYAKFSHEFQSTVLKFLFIQPTMARYAESYYHLILKKPELCTKENLTKMHQALPDNSRGKMVLTCVLNHFGELYLEDKNQVKNTV